MSKDVGALAAALCAGSLAAQEQEAADALENLAIDEEMSALTESIGRINCGAQTAEKEGHGLFKIGGAACRIGQHGIRLNGDQEVISMSRG